MSGYFNITLDTVGPQGVSICVNGDEEHTSDKQLSLEILCSDNDTTNYQMKIWSNVLLESDSEENAKWEDYSREKILTIDSEIPENTEATFYVKLRDDVWNESETASDNITIYTQNPTVIIASITRDRISKIPAAPSESPFDKLFSKNTSMIIFGADRDCDDLKIMVVQDINAFYDDPANVLIPTDGSSCITNDDGEILTGSGGMQISQITERAAYRAYIKGADLEAASPGDGVKIIKIFAHERNGEWSI